MPRSSKRQRKDNEAHGSQLAMDLFVSLPKKTTTAGDNVPSKLVLSQVLRRLADTGYGTVALTHTMYGGRPRDPEDRSANVMKQYNDLLLPTSKQQPPLRSLHRLHVVVESLSDLALFNNPTTPNSLHQQLLNEYDLISISPRNELVFQAACTCHGVDIVTLDGAASHNRLPFRLRATDLAALANRGAVLEIPYATSVLHVAARKGWVQMGRELSTILATRGGGGATVPTLHVVCSSASRLVENVDVGPMALRTPGDLTNLLRVVLGLESRTAAEALFGVSGNVALAHAAKRRHGNETLPSSIRVVKVTVNPEQNPKTLPVQHTSNEGQTLMDHATGDVHPNDANNDDASDGDQVEDGFISF
jgi:RNase P/RNase MRP subunit p30